MLSTATMKLHVSLALFVTTAMFSMGCAESLPRRGPPTSPATLTSATIDADRAPNPSLKDSGPPWMTDEELPSSRFPAASEPEGVWAPRPAPVRTWGVPSKSDLPDYL
jgi:hypothetical protein